MAATNPLSNGSSVHNGRSLKDGNADGLTTAPSHKPMPPIAIIGMACRFAGDATSPSKLWELCKEGKDGWSPIPAQRFDIKSWYNEDWQKQGRSHVKGGYFLNEDVALFDAAFFNLSGEAARTMDPQTRLLLETVYEATEDAGIPIERMAGSNASVLIGCFSKDYHEMQARDPELTAPAALGTGTAMLSNRISHFYDLHGPSMSIDTGCSAGLVALHQGCRSIWSGESDISIVGGVNALLNQDLFIAMSTFGVLGSDGKCYAWDARAQGFGRGEGVAALILKPLTAALRDGDRFHALIRGSGLNQDGKTPTISSPSKEAQIKLIRDCYQQVGFDLSETGYVEAHMTGTSIGDPIEAEALAETFGQSRRADDPVIVGSVKTNVGHTESVSGLASVIKTSFALRERVIPPNLNYKTANPNIHLDEWHLQVPTTLKKWPENKLLRASINNFGYGGTNAHVIMESPAAVASMQPAKRNRTEASDRSRVYILSAKDAAAAKAMMGNFSAHIRESLYTSQTISPDDLAYTLAKRRSLLPWAIAITANSLEDLCDRWDSPATKALHSTKPPRLGFVFNGQGAQWHAMSRELIQEYPLFCQRIRDADQVLTEYGAAWSLYEELMRNENATRVAEINLGQAMTVAVQLCLVDLLESWGIKPSAVTSHSSGEIAAAYTVGALSFKQALGVVYYRGELALKYQKLASLQGGMLAAGLGAESVDKYLTDLPTRGRVVVACVNSPNSITFSGDIEALDEVASRLEKDGVFAKKLNVPMAYHSHHMLYMAEEYTQKLQEILLDKHSWSGILFSSPVTGELVTAAEVLSPSHWTRNLTGPVLFSQALETMCFGSKGTTNVDVIIEIGAHSTLAGPIRQILMGRKVNLPYVSCLKRPVDAVETMQELVCELLGRGYPIDLEAVNSPLGGETHAFVPDLPTYPWNHSARYWSESRVSKELKNKKFPPHELLGSAMSGTNSCTPTWRNFLRLSELEWLRDHQVDSKIVLPGAAYIVMAIEAVRILTDASEETIRGYRLREIDILHALVIPESSAGVEIQICLRQCNEKELDYKGWYEFDVCSLGTGGYWVENCKGYVSAETGEQVKVATTREIKPPRPDVYLNGLDAGDINIPSLFDSLQAMGIQHGPVFQNLIHSRGAGAKAITTFALAEVASVTYDYVLHPTTLDSIFQATYASLPKDRARDSMALPRSIGTIFVPKNLRRLGGEKLQAYTELVTLNMRGLTSNIMVLNQDANDGLDSSFLQIRDFFCQAVPTDWNEADPEAASLCSRNCWELDVLHRVPDDIKDYLKAPINNTMAEAERKRVRASYNYIYDAVCELEADGQNLDAWQWHHKLFYDWMKSIVALGESGQLRPGSQTWSKTTKDMKHMLAEELAVTGPMDQLLVRVGERLADIVRGVVTPLELMMEGELLNRYYMEHAVSAGRVYKQGMAFLELYAVKNPGAAILEIGAGTGGATKSVLEAFEARSRADGLGGSLVGHYTFTDISKGFFSAARKKLADWEDIITFQQLDIEKDPVTQTFNAGSFDLIIAAMVLHATKSLHKTMTHVRKLLKPGGKLLLIETMQDRLDVQMEFGTLPGWWLGEEPDRKVSPNVSVETWDRVLRETGFSGVDLEIRDFEEPEFHSISAIVSSAVMPVAVRGPISIVHLASAPPPAAWLSQVSEQIEAHTGISPLIESLNHVDAQNKTCIFMAEMEHPFVDVLNEASFGLLQKLVVQCSGLLWLSCGSLVDAIEPSYAATQGLLRTLKVEDTTKRFVHLDFERGPEGSNVWTIDKADYIIHVLQQSFDESLDTASIECEYAVKNSMLHVSRLYPDKAQSQLCSYRQVDPAPKLQPFRQPGRPLVWERSPSGLLSDTHFTDKLYITGDVPSGMVEIETKAFGLNFRDVLLALGQLNDTTQGSECSGIVTRLGPNTEKSGLQIGDRVCAIVPGNYVSMAWAFWTGVAKLPDEISFEEGASIPTAYTTAYHSLFHIAKVEKGESVLVHAAAGGFGQACVILAQYLGARVFATCSSETKRDLLVQEYGLNPDHILSSRDESFAPALMELTGGNGVDVVINSLSGNMLKATWDCIARFGRFIEAGKMDMEAGRHLELTPFRRCAIYAGVDLLQLGRYNGPLAREALVNSVRICHDRKTRPISPITTYSITDIEKAMRQMQGGTHMGKIVLVPNPGDLVKVVTRPRPVSLDDTQATYLVVGGLTGIGRVIAEWMITKGARHMVLVSRHATSHPKVDELRSRGEAAGCNLVVRDCDVSDENSLVQLIADCALTMPPIRGVVNGAMLLDDTIFERMTFDQWRHGVVPKINTTRNLHNHLPNLSFFIMLASLLGVCGHASQANYAAGNTFQDALVRQRTSHGQPAVSLDLSGVMGAGYVAEKDERGEFQVRARLEKFGLSSVNVAQVLRLVEGAIRDPLRATPAASQVVVGITEHTVAPWGKGPLAQDRRFSTMRLASPRRRLQGKDMSQTSAAATHALVRGLKSAETVDEAAALLLDALVDKLADIFNIPRDEIDVSLPLSHYGVDSLVAVELRNWLSAVRAKVSVFEVLQGATLIEFAALLAARSDYMVSTIGAEPAEGEAPTEANLDESVQDDAE